MKKAKNGMKWVCIGVAMVTASVVAGCGTKESKEPEAPAVASQAVPAPKKKRFPEIEIRLADEKNQRLPGDQQAPFSKGTYQKENEILFADVIPVTDEVPLYLTFDAATIQDAYYLFERRDDLNQKAGDEVRHNAFRTEDGTSWYVPVLEVVGGKAKNADPTETQIIKLELHTTAGQTVVLQILLRLRGPVPMISMLEQSYSTHSLKSMIHELNSGQYSVYREEMANSSTRTVKVWIGQVDGAFTYASGVRHSFFISTGQIVGEDLILDGKNEFTHSRQGGSRVSEIHVRRQNGKIDRFLPSSWIAFALRPSERVEVSYVLAFDGITNCQLPATETQVFDYRLPPRVVCRHGECQQEEGPRRSTRRSSEWVVDGVSLWGNLTKSILVTDDDFTGDDPTTATSTLMESQKSRGLNHGVGDLGLYQRERFANCPNGVF